ncbi:CPBP family intramembrane metalloprotease [Aliiglaciecola sp. CAU 1673]|uniref:CPBP family intramembrane glutamic endopeptidase n=1 Tax=Aliiglaciecola sp. CAU 1673 TaxID=3032595 RepID=UPI0023DBE486|nr:CPBP family intramembrane glutamic endopeptidase [Aliiglaciecola sp. CAU 1673]MDF2179767.1 CPBP family intramembrane metalloprotease [Aliiglaciecola sp. CAU 1673]
MPSTDSPAPVQIQSKIHYWQRTLILILAGFAGILSALPLIPNLLDLAAESPPFPIPVIQAISTLQSTIVLIAMVFIGAKMAPKAGLGTPIVDAWLVGAWVQPPLRQILLSAIAGGILGGLALVAFYQLYLPYLPATFVENVKELMLPLSSRLLYGGITEELLVRYGMMSFLVWLGVRLTQKQGDGAQTVHYVVAILLSAVIFALGHLPVTALLTPELTMPLVFYVMMGNSLFGLIAGYLYWRHGLESAMLAHMLAHLVTVTLEGMF